MPADHKKLKNADNKYTVCKRGVGSPEKIAKVIADRGFASRREAERLVKKGIVKVNGTVINKPAERIASDAHIEINGNILKQKPEIRMWRFYKPIGTITTSKDPQCRTTVFDILPKRLPRLISVGRLDVNTEGLLVFTNDGLLARKLELPSSNIRRTYKVRVFGRLTKRITQEIEGGITIDNMKYGKIKIELSGNLNEDVVKNHWLLFSLCEGKNREIRKIFEYFDLQVNRLIRISYGIFFLDDLKFGEIVEVPRHIVQDIVKSL
jgi:23S rRNA pseudouridine2605 synthase